MATDAEFMTYVADQAAGAGATASSIFPIIPTFSRPAGALAVAAELARQGIPAAAIHVVDHAPAPSVDAAAAAALGVIVVRGDPAAWWSGAVNCGLRAAMPKAADGDRILAMNDDARILPGYVDALRRIAAEIPRALVGSVCLDGADESVRYADLRLRRLRAEFASGYRGRRPDALPAGAALECDVLSGRGLLIPAGAFREIGLFDERRLPHYTADYELSWRARRAGWRLVCAADARLATAWERRGDPRRGLLGYALDRRLPGNLVATYGFARSCFDGPYALWFTSLAGARLLAGYVLDRRGRP